MVALSTDKFGDLLRRSELVDQDALDQAIAKIEREAGLSIDGPALADKLVEARLITPWHREKLLEGKYKGFRLGDKYKLLGHIGTGGMSTVYLAEHSKMQRLVAIKLLPKKRVNDSSYLARFYREAQAAAKLDHKNIVRAYDIDHQDDNHFLVMEYVEGRDLQTYVRDAGQLDYDLAADFIRQAAEGLEHAHQAGLIHRDIKPSNLLVDQRGVVKVLDMGLARWEDDKAASLTIAHEENVLGTADYLAPEQAKNSHSVDKRADIYSLGCTLYFLLTGHAPFPTGSLPERIAKHLSEMPKSIYEDRRDAPQALVDVCLRMMAKNAEARYQSAGEVAATLTKWLQSRGKDVTGDSTLRGDSRPVGPPPRRPLHPPRRKDKSSDDDTVSNRNQDTIKGKSNSFSPPRGPARPSSDSQILHGGSSVRISGSSIIRHGSSIVRADSSSVLGGKSGALKGSGKSLPVAKSLKQKDDEPLSSLLEEAAELVQHEMEDRIRAGANRTPARPNQPNSPAGYTPSYRQPSADGGLPIWAWAVIGAAIVAALIGVAIIASSGG
ncbi:MAG: serine/threonine protein kinase [Pirellulales bacterium]|nr:serine/threonine protein kinase [Pirellulales bacterium]